MIDNNEICFINLFNKYQHLNEPCFEEAQALEKTDTNTCPGGN